MVRIANFRTDLARLTSAAFFRRNSRGGRNREWHRQSIGHPDDNITDRIACPEVPLYMWSLWHGPGSLQRENPIVTGLQYIKIDLLSHRRVRKEVCRSGTDLEPEGQLRLKWKKRIAGRAFPQGIRAPQMDTWGSSDPGYWPCRLAAFRSALLWPPD